VKLSRNQWIALCTIVLLAILSAFFLSSPSGAFLRSQWTDSGIPEMLASPILSLGSLAITPSLLVGSVFFFVFLAVFASLTRRLLQDRLLSRTSLDSGQRYAYSRITSYIIFLFGLIIGLQTAGVNLSSLLVFGGAVGIGAGLGLQALANNFVSGLVLLVERPIKLGDRVEVGGILGDIVRMAARSTWVRTNDNVVIIVPNSEFTASRVVNWTANDRRVRFSLDVGVSYGSDPSKVREILLATARSHPEVLTDPPPDVLFLGFGDSAINFELRVWTIGQVQTPKILVSDLYFAIFKTFREQGIEIPFPQRDLHLKSISRPIPVSQA
jgi:small-conductance mechanosensitive channel